MSARASSGCLSAKIQAVWGCGIKRKKRNSHRLLFLYWHEPWWKAFPSAVFASFFFSAPANQPLVVGTTVKFPYFPPWTLFYPPFLFRRLLGIITKKDILKHMAQIANRDPDSILFNWPSPVWSSGRGAELQPRTPAEDTLTSSEGSPAKKSPQFVALPALDTWKKVRLKVVFLPFPFGLVGEIAPNDGLKNK